MENYFGENFYELENEESMTKKVLKLDKNHRSKEIYIHNSEILELQSTINENRNILNNTEVNYHNLENRIVEELEKNPMLEIEEDDESVESNEDEDSFNIEDLESSTEEFDVSYYYNTENCKYS